MGNVRRSGDPEQAAVREQVGQFLKGAGRAVVGTRRRKIATWLLVALALGCGILYALGYGDVVPLLIETVVSIGSET